MAIANALSKTALKIIKQFGRDVTLNTITAGEYNPDTGTSEISSASTIKAVKGTYKAYDYRDGVIKIGDAPLYTTSELKNDDTITIGTQNYSIVSVEEYSVESSVVLYVANIRKV